MGKTLFLKAVRIGGFLAAASVLALSALGAPLVHANGSSFSGAGGGTTNDPYLVTSCAQFQDINNNDDGYNGFNKAYRLTQNLNCNSTGNAIMADGDFTGSFDGDGHSISIQMTGSHNYLGLFKIIDGGTVTDLTVNGSVAAGAGSGEVGMLAGLLQNGATVSGITINANITNPGGASAVGGVAGNNVTGTVTDTVVTGFVSSGSNNVGGLFGNSVCQAHISDSHSSAMVYSGADNIGGIVGNDGCEGPGTTYDNVYSTGSVTGKDNVGGIVGNAPGSTIIDSHSSSDIMGLNNVGGIAGTAMYGTSISRSYHEYSNETGTVHGDDKVGGIVGSLETSSSVSQSYSNSYVESNGLAGGIVAYIDSGSSVSDSYSRSGISGGETSGGAVGSINSGTIHRTYSTGMGAGGGLVGHDGSGNSSNGLFWDTESSSQENSALGTGKTTAQMKNANTYISLTTPGLGSTAWDFIGNYGADDGSDDIWGIDTDVNDGYPCLVWQSVGCTFNGPGSSTPDPDPDPDPDEDEGDNGGGDNGGNDVEADAPNGGDANNDGTADNTQDNVTSFVNSVSGKYVTVEAPSACSLSSVSAAAESSNVAADASYSYPNGLVNFTADCGTPGYTANLKVFTYGNSNDFVLRKYNSVTHTYANVPGATLSQQTIGGQTVTVASYSITDGGVLDEDGTANGTIVDPVGLAIAGNATSTPQSGGNNSANAAGAGSNSAAANGSGTLADTGQPMLFAAIAALILIASSIVAHRTITVRARNE